MATTERLSIGAVVFKDPETRQYVPLMGDRRVAALTAFYLRQPIPGDLIPSHDWYNNNRGFASPLPWESVAWETSGIPKREGSRNG